MSKQQDAIDDIRWLSNHLKGLVAFVDILQDWDKLEAALNGKKDIIAKLDESILAKKEELAEVEMVVESTQRDVQTNYVLAKADAQKIVNEAQRVSGVILEASRQESIDLVAEATKKVDELEAERLTLIEKVKELRALAGVEEQRLVQTQLALKSIKDTI